jgi:hypothetical protein
MSVGVTNASKEAGELPRLATVVARAVTTGVGAALVGAIVAKVHVLDAARDTSAVVVPTAIIAVGGGSGVPAGSTSASSSAAPGIGSGGTTATTPTGVVVIPVGHGAAGSGFE